MVNGHVMSQAQLRKSPEVESKADGFSEARSHIRSAIRRAESAGVSSETVALALISEALPRIVRNHGRAWTAAVLMKLAGRINAGLF
jgi:hypothetical protein